MGSIYAGERFTTAVANSIPLPVTTLTTGSGGASSTAEAVIGTFTIPAGDMTTAGNGYYWRTAGSIDFVSSQTCRWRVRIGGLTGTVLYDSGTIMAVAGGPFSGRIQECWGGIYFDAVGAGGSCYPVGILVSQTFQGTPATLLTDSNTTTRHATGVDTTASQSLVLTAQFSTSSASNTARTLIGSLYRM